VKGRCGTRALKVVRYVEATLPADFPTSGRQALSEMSPRLLSRLHRVTDPQRVVADPHLAQWLAANPVPAPVVGAGHPLFRGTFVFVQVTWNRTNQAPFATSATDIQTAIAYAAQAVVPIQQYASQYGPSDVSVSPTLLGFTVDLGNSNSFSPAFFEDVVDDIVRTNSLVGACVVVLHDDVTPGSPVNTKTIPDANNFRVFGYHGCTDDGNPFIFSLAFGTNLTMQDPLRAYAHVLSHEIAETVVDPRANLDNPEVCDACFGNCKNFQFNLFDATNAFVGGTQNPATTPTPFAFYINSIIKPEFYDADTECALPGSNPVDVCVYPPPSLWSGPGRVTTQSGPVSVAGHFSTGDNRHLVLVGRRDGGVHEVFWKPAQVGIEGEDDLPVDFGNDGIAGVGSMYNTDEQRHVALVATTSGQVEEIFWRADTVGVEGQDALPVDFDPGSIVAVSGHYAPDQQRYVVVVATNDGQLREIFWKSTTVGIEGTDTLPVSFGANGIVDACVFYNTDERRNVVVVAEANGRLHEIFWKELTVGIEGHDQFPLDFGSGGIVAVSGFYDPFRQRHVVVAGAADGKVHQVYWKALTVGIEAHSVVAQYPSGSIVSVAGFYSQADQVEHVVAALNTGEVFESWLLPTA
jgi:hypothetical protein